MAIIVFGISHRTAPVEIRERLAVPEAALPEELRRLKEAGIADEAVILSTCNRVEIYLATGAAARDAAARLRRFIAERHPDQSSVIDRFYMFAEPESLRHLFRVAAGLDSMVVGETEVFGQIKRAYQIALQNGATARALNRAFQSAFRTAKQIRTETNIQRGSVSVASVAVDLAERIFSSLRNRTVMVVGAGDTGEKTARALLGRGVGRLLVTNRSLDRAESLAADFGGEVVPFGDWMGVFSSVDILISSTSAPGYLLDTSNLGPLMRERRQRPLLLIDIGVPRDIDPAVHLMENVFLYNIDDLQGIATEALRQREEEIAKCEALIEDKVAGLMVSGRRPDTTNPEISLADRQSMHRPSFR